LIQPARPCAQTYRLSNCANTDEQTAHTSGHALVCLRHCHDTLRPDVIGVGPLSVRDAHTADVSCLSLMHLRLYQRPFKHARNDASRPTLALHHQPAQKAHPHTEPGAVVGFHLRYLYITPSSKRPHPNRPRGSGSTSLHLPTCRSQPLHSLPLLWTAIVPLGYGANEALARSVSANGDRCRAAQHVGCWRGRWASASRLLALPCWLFDLRAGIRRFRQRGKGHLLCTKVPKSVPHTRDTNADGQAQRMPAL